MTYQDWIGRMDRIFANDVFYFRTGGLDKSIKDDTLFTRCIIDYLDCYGTMYGIARTTDKDE